jgi:hypothetical protein
MIKNFLLLFCFIVFLILFVTDCVVETSKTMQKHFQQIELIKE